MRDLDLLNSRRMMDQIQEGVELRGRDTRGCVPGGREIS